MDGVIRALEEVGVLMGRQTQERDAIIAQAVEAAVAITLNGNNGNRGHVNANRLMHQLVEQFLKLKPPKFDGGGDLVAASLWVEELEKAFDVLGRTDEEKVTLAVYQLRGNASDWWKATRRRVFPAGTAQTWAMFVETFNNKYFSKSAKEKELVEFMRLYQGQRTVDQYEAKFTKLSKFAPRMMKDPWDRARRFRDGLKPNLRSQMISLNLRDYNEIYDRAQAIKRDLADRDAASGSRYVSARDNRNLGKRPMTEDQHLFLPLEGILENRIVIRMLYASCVVEDMGLDLVQEGILYVIIVACYGFLD
ncbi:uncharacterized protein LOC130139270 [Syzygium oleosum]|uniref:uncharacterized protein LOC130139270 n=1 Tax=Syzygium oleosum TaxID=219896 RepID=UPI0024BB7B9F|nr:uncharacterized protein LOC130139270 [Syzygium oleosum]